MYKIGELSKLCRIPVKTLRFYDGEGLLTPDEVDPFSGYRYYSASKLAQCYQIIALKELGFSLEEIRMQLKAGSRDEVIRLLAAKQEQMRARKEKLEIQLKQLTTMQRIISEGKNTMMHIVIGSGEALRVAACRKIYASKEEAMSETEQIRKALPAGMCAGRRVIINYETEYRESGLDLAACCEITGVLPKDCGYGEKMLGFAGDTASLVCKAEELDEGYGAMVEYLYENAYQIVGAACEIYYEDGSAELKMPVCKRVSCQDAPVDEALFENDPQAVGKWRLIDIVPSREQFVYGNPKTPDLEEISLKELYFLEGGEGYWIIGGWTKGKLRVSAEFPARHMVEEPYTLETVAGHTLLFHEVKDRYPDGTVDGAPQLWVYEKASDDVLKAEDIRIRDNTDHPFVNDETVLGKWDVYDFYARDMESFDPDKQNRERDRLFLRSVEFAGGGTCVYTYSSGSREFAWTKGLVLNRGAGTASAYRIEERGGARYLILEWKSGDYSFSGRINWYVLKRS